MNHAITIGGLLTVCTFLVGVVFLGLGALMAFAGGMSDALAEGERMSTNGCTLALIGIFLIAGCIFGMFVG